MTPAFLLLLAQVAGGSFTPPTCSPVLVSGTPCIWRGYPLKAYSVQHPDEFILVSVLSQEPTVRPITPGTNPSHITIRHFQLTFIEDFASDAGITCDLPHETYRLHLQIGTPCLEGRAPEALDPMERR